MIKSTLIFGAAALHAFTADASALTLPDTATQTARIAKASGSLFLPTGPWSAAETKGVTPEGHVSQTAWRIPDALGTTLDLLDPFRSELASDGYEVVYECETDVCGGFDFRFAVEVLPEPEMHVDLGDFRYLVARRAGIGGAEYLALLVSRSAESAFVQLSEVVPEGSPATEVEEAPATAGSAAVDGSDGLEPSLAGIGSELEAKGTVALDDLVFETGSAQLGPGVFTSLTDLAAYLAKNPERKITLVGHTDALGPLPANIALSRRRAESVAERLVQSLSVRPDQVSAEGVGFLSPRASNLDDEGRRKNRRVEAMLASTR